jgi:hypothetical protein
MFRMQINFKREFLAFLFGALVILLNFGDGHTGPTIGNLDTIFGVLLWPLMDIIYPLASIYVFITYGRAKSNGVLKFNVKTAIPLIAYLLAIFLLSIDDVSLVLNLGLGFPKAYWIAIMWLYPAISFLAFFSFGQANQNERR